MDDSHPTTPNRTAQPQRVTKAEQELCEHCECYWDESAVNPCCHCAWRPRTT